MILFKIRLQLSTHNASVGIVRVIRIIRKKIYQKSNESHIHPENLRFGFNSQFFGPNLSFDPLLLNCTCFSEKD